MSQWKPHSDEHIGTTIPSHYSQIFDPEKFRELVKATDSALQAINKRIKFDAIATCGHSGNLLGAVVSHEMGIPLLVVRKACEDSNSHHGYDITGITKARVLLLDDLIDSGKTIAHMLFRLKTPEASWIKRELTPVGCLMTSKPLRYNSPDSLAERELWAAKVGKFDKTDCRPLPVFYVRHVVIDKHWPALCPKPISMEDEVAPEELPPITLKKKELADIVIKVKRPRKPRRITPPTEPTRR